MKRVILESPYAGDVAANRRYARRCAWHMTCEMGESPIASHLLFPQFLDDKVPNDRALGIAAGLAWRPVADYSAFYTDRGWSNGMRAALWSALKENRPLVLRAFGKVQLPISLDEEIKKFLKGVIDYENGERINLSSAA